MTTRLEGTHPVFTLLEDTAYERLEVLAVASPVMLCASGKVQGGVMAERWSEGMRLGEEHFVTCATDGVVVRTRSVQLIPNAMSMDLLNKFGGAPWAAAGIVEFQGSISGPSQTQRSPFEIREPFILRNMRNMQNHQSQHRQVRLRKKSCPRLPGVSTRRVAQSRERRDWIEQKIRGDSEFKKRALKYQRSERRTVTQERFNDLHGQLDTTTEVDIR